MEAALSPPERTGLDNATSQPWSCLVFSMSPLDSRILINTFKLKKKIFWFDMVRRKCAECDAEGATGSLHPWPHFTLCWQIRQTSACKRVAAIAPTLCRGWDTHKGVEKTVESAKTAWVQLMTDWVLDCGGRLYKYIYICTYIYIYIYNIYV